MSLLPIWAPESKPPCFWIRCHHPQKASCIQVGWQQVLARWERLAHRSRQAAPMVTGNRSFCEWKRMERKPVARESHFIMVLWPFGRQSIKININGSYMELSILPPWRITWSVAILMGLLEGTEIGRVISKSIGWAQASSQSPGHVTWEWCWRKNLPWTSTQ
jgi:hypothetical protein